MPNARYRRKLRNNYRSNEYGVMTSLSMADTYSPHVVDNTITYSNLLSPNGILTLEKIQNDINDIIDTIALKMEFDKVIEMASTLQSALKSKEDLLILIDNIENTVLSIIQNLADRVELNIILRRIEYLRTLIDELEPTCCVSYEGPIAELILEIIDMFSKLAPIEDITTSISNVHYIINNTLKNDEYIRNAEEYLLSIIQNIADNVSYSIIILRIHCLKEIVDKIDDTCIFYNSAYMNEIINIINILSIPELFTNGIYQIVCEKMEALHSDIFKKVRCMELVKESEELLCSIIQNITDRVDLNIAIRRIEYLKTILDQIKNF